MTVTDSTGTNIYANILANPDDTGLKLIYADWLEENWQEDRAEMIRNSKKMIWERDATKNFPRWRWRHCKGDDESIDGWIGAPVKYTRILRRDINQHLRSKCDKIIFRNGFISEVHCNMLNFIEHGWKVVANHPVTMVVLKHKKPIERNGLVCFYMSSVDPSQIDRLNKEFENQELGQNFYTTMHNIVNKGSIDSGIFQHFNEECKESKYRTFVKGEIVKQYNTCYASFNSEQSAIDALSGACIRYAKQKSQTTT